MRLNKQSAVAVALTVALVATGPALAVEPVKTTLVVDPCRSAPAYEEVPERTSEVTMIDLPIEYYLYEEAALPIPVGLPGEENVAGGATFATLPGYEQQIVFIAAGKNLYVHELRNTEFDELGNPISDIRLPINTVDVASLTGISGLQLGRVAAGNYRPVEVSPGVLYGQASLYLTGTVGDDAAYYVILDQQWLIEGASPNGTHLYGFGQICVPQGNCDVTDVLDIEIGAGYDAQYTEWGYISVVQDYGIPVQMNYRLDRGLSETGHSLAPIFGDAWMAGGETVAAELGTAGSSGDFYIARKSTGTVRNLADSTETCTLAGEPNAVAVWEPGLAGAEPRYLFVATKDAGQPSVTIVPAASCANGGSSILSIPLSGSGDPVSLDVWDIDDDELWVVVVTNGAEATYQAIQLKLTRPGGVDTFTLVGNPQVESYGMDNPALDASCPAEVQAFTRSQWISLDWPDVCGSGGPFKNVRKCDPLERNCLPSDPRCEEEPTPKP